VALIEKMITVRKSKTEAGERSSDFLPPGTLRKAREALTSRDVDPLIPTNFPTGHIRPMRNDVTYITESSGPYGVNQN